ncbi:VOC family protein [Niabella terrae]
MNDTNLITGLHHVTAISSGATTNLEFYAGLLGLRLVKKTVNFDAPSVYHFYYGNDIGAAGSILTFFPYEGLRGGRQGKGMLNTTAFSVPLAALDYWLERLKKFKVAHKHPQERFKGEAVVYFEDPDGLGLELVFNEKDQRAGITAGPVPAAFAIKGIYNVEIWLEGFERTAALLTSTMDHQLIGEKSNRFRYAVRDIPGHYVDLICMPDSLKGLAGSGTVHHLAYATRDRESLQQVREKLITQGHNLTPVMDRKYFESVYFREPGGVLFELATATPGFDLDESASALGSSLMLPGWMEPDREALEKALPPLTPNLKNFK